MVRVAWIGKFRPGSEYIKLMRRIIGDYFKFDYLGELYNDDVRKLEDYDFVFGNTNLLGVFELVRMRSENGRPRFFKIMSMKYAHRKYRPMGFYEVYDAKYVENPKVGSKVLVISRHRDVGIPKDRIVRRVYDFVESPDTAFWMMKKYGANDLFWIHDLYVYEELIRKFGVMPLRSVRNEADMLELYRIIGVDGKKWYFGR